MMENKNKKIILTLKSEVDNFCINYKNTSLKINIAEPSDEEFENVFSEIIKIVNSVFEQNTKDGIEQNVLEIELEPFDLEGSANPPKHREFLVSFKEMLEKDINLMFEKYKEISNL